MNDREIIDSLAEYRPGSTTYEVSLTFKGEAGILFGMLMSEFNTDNPNEVVKRGIALLMSAHGKEILLKDPKTGAIEIVEI